MGRARRKAPAGWERAPSAIELEIRAVWQEDDMPDELKSSPGYRPFTLGNEAQAWVDSMAEIMDGGGAVYGRPRPATPIQRRSLASSPPAAQPPDRWTAPASPPPTPWTGSQPASSSPPPSTIPAARVLMPDIEGSIPSATPPRTLPRRVMMPEIGDEKAPGPEQPRRPAMPDIGVPDAQQASQPRPQMPDIASDEDRPKEKRPLMPDIG